MLIAVIFKFSVNGYGTFKSILKFIKCDKQIRAIWFNIPSSMDV